MEKSRKVYGGKNEETYFNRRIRANREFTGFVYQKKGIQTVRLSVSIIKRSQLNLLRKRV